MSERNKMEIDDIENEVEIDPEMEKKQKLLEEIKINKDEDHFYVGLSNQG